MAGSLLFLLDAAASLGGTCYEMFYVILRYLPRWMDRELNVLNVPSVQWKYWRCAFYVNLMYPVTVYYQSKKRNLKILHRLPC